MRLTRLVCQRLMGLLVMLALTYPVLAQVAPELRQFPPNTLRGVLDMSAYPDVKMDGKPRYLAPSSRIYGTDNLIVLPSTLNDSQIQVNYTENPFGDVEKIWILTRTEIGQTLPVPEVWKPIPFKNPEIK